MATDPMWCYEQYEDAAAYIDRLEKQRDELLYLLEEAIGYTSCTSWSPSLTEEIISAIASVKEKQNAAD